MSIILSSASLETAIYNFFPNLLLSPQLYTEVFNKFTGFVSATMPRNIPGACAEPMSGDLPMTALCPFRSTWKCNPSSPHSLVGLSLCMQNGWRSFSADKFYSMWLTFYPPQHKMHL